MFNCAGLGVTFPRSPSACAMWQVRFLLERSSGRLALEADASSDLADASSDFNSKYRNSRLRHEPDAGCNVAVALCVDHITERH